MSSSKTPTALDSALARLTAALDANSPAPVCVGGSLAGTAMLKIKTEALQPSNGLPSNCVDVDSDGEDSSARGRHST